LPFLFLCPLFENAGGCAEAFSCFFTFELRCEEAQFGILDNLFDDFWFFVALEWAFFGQVEAGDLQTVKQQPCAARVDVVRGDALEHLTDAVLDGAAVFGQRQGKGFAEAFALGELFEFGRSAGGVVEVAEFFSAKTWAAATAAIDVDTAALVTCWFWCVHRDPSPGAVHS